MSAIPTASSLLGGYVVEIFMAILYVRLLRRFRSSKGIDLRYRLYGISIAQSYVYWLNCEQDAAYLKIIVAVVM